MRNDGGNALRVLVVDDEVDEANALAHHLMIDGYACDVATDGNAAVAVLEKDDFDVVISDVRMQGMDGIELLHHIRRTRRVPVILVSAYKGINAASAREHGATRFLAKPYDVDAIRDMLRGELARDADLLARGQPPGARADVEVVGPTMIHLLSQLGRAARARSPVLVCGETGTGKEVVARALHAMGPRPDRPFVAINVSAVPSELLESELFGHARGSFTGAAAARRGLLSEADGGTLLLDEIGDMPFALQAKLLRVLQDGEVRPVGADKSRPVDVRFIAATHRDLASLVQKGQFRHDLLFRLNVIPITVPPLRDRREDIAPLATHFLAAARRRVPDSPVTAIEPEAMALLFHAPWPGNVRELESVVERIVILGRTPAATREDAHAALALSGGAEPDAGGSSAYASPPLRSIEHVVREHVAAVMKHTHGNKTKAAKILGVNLSTLYRWRSNAGKA